LKYKTRAGGEYGSFISPCSGRQDGSRVVA
jgi:hypothetical protein